MTKASKAAVEAENVALKRQLEAAAISQASLTQHFGPMARGVGELWVGIRNVSDNTLGVKSPFSHEADLDLHGSAVPDLPGSQAVISYAWWLQLRHSSWVAKGVIVRDDSVMAGHFTPAPADLPQDLPKEAADNVVLDPHTWITERNEAALEADLRRITSKDSLRRLRRAVEDRLRDAQRDMLGDPNAPRKAFDQLPPNYRRVDELTTLLLERPDMMR